MTIEKTMNILSTCDGNCKACKHWHMKFSEVNEHLTVYAHYCNIARRTGYTWYGERLATLKEETLKCLQSEVEFSRRSCKT